MKKRSTPTYADILGDRLALCLDKASQPKLSHPEIGFQHECAAAMEVLLEARPSLVSACLEAMGGYQGFLDAYMSPQDLQSKIGALQVLGAPLGLTGWGLFVIFAAARLDPQMSANGFRTFAALDVDKAGVLLMEARLLHDIANLLTDQCEDATQVLQALEIQNSLWQLAFDEFRKEVLIDATGRGYGQKGPKPQLWRQSSRNDIAMTMQVTCLGRGYDDTELLRTENESRRDRINLKKDGLRSAVSRGKKLISSYADHLWRRIHKDSWRSGNLAGSPQPEMTSAPPCFLGVN